MNEDELDFPPVEPNVWVCQSCGHRFKASWPKDREKFYANPKPRTCPRCKSPDAMPQGF